MLAFKIFQNLISPTIFISIVILIGLILYIKLKKKRAGEILILIGFILFYLFSIKPISDLIIWPLEKQYQQINENQINQANTIVLLRGGREADILRSGEAVRLYTIGSRQQAKKYSIIISGTDPLPKGLSNSAKELSKIVEDWGIPAENILIDDQSRNTLESALNIKKLVDNRPFFLVTSSYHLPRSMLVFKILGTNPIPAPADFKINKAYDLFSFFPSPGNLEKVDLSVHEYLGYLYYKFKLL